MSSRVALEAGDADRSHRHHAVDIGPQPLLETRPIRFDDNVADIGFIDDDANAASGEILLWNQGRSIVIVLAIDAFDPVDHRFEVGQRNLSSDQVFPERRKGGRTERLCAFEIDVAEREADGSELLDRQAGNRGGVRHGDARGALRRRLEPVDDGCLLSDDAIGVLRLCTSDQNPEQGYGDQTQRDRETRPTTPFHPPISKSIYRSIKLSTS